MREDEGEESPTILKCEEYLDEETGEYIKLLVTRKGGRILDAKEVERRTLTREDQERLGLRRK